MVSLYLFFMGFLGILTNRRHFLVVIICIEMILLSVNLTSEYKIIKKLKNISNNELHVKSIFPLSKVSILNEK